MTHYIYLTIIFIISGYAGLLRYSVYLLNSEEAILDEALSNLQDENDRYATANIELRAKLAKSLQARERNRQPSNASTR